MYGHWRGCLCSNCGKKFESHNSTVRVVNSVWIAGVVTCSCEFCQDRYHEGMKARHAANTYDLTEGRQPAMASINVCEREGCETLMKGAALGGVALTYTIDAHNTDIRPDKAVKKLELCPGCIQDVHDLLKQAPLSPREKAYAKPFNPDGEQSIADDLSNVQSDHLMAVLMQRLMKDGKALKSLEGAITEENDE